MNARTVIAPDTPTPVAWVFAIEEWEGDFGYWCYSHHEDLAQEAERGARFLLVEKDERGNDVVRGVEGHVHLADFMYVAGSVEGLETEYQKLSRRFEMLALLVESLAERLERDAQRVELVELLAEE